MYDFVRHELRVPFLRTGALKAQEEMPPARHEAESLVANDKKKKEEAVLLEVSLCRASRLGSATLPTGRRARSRS